MLIVFQIFFKKVPSVRVKVRSCREIFENEVNRFYDRSANWIFDIQYPILNIHERVGIKKNTETHNGVPVLEILF